MDVGSEMIDSLQELFLEEVWKQIERVDAFIAEKINLEFISLENEEVDAFFRLLHGIKGTASMMGYASMAEVAHNAENLFVYLKEEKNPEQKDMIVIFRLLKIVSGYLKRELRRIETGEDLVDFGTAVIVKIQNFLGHIEGEFEGDTMNDGVQYTRRGRKLIPFVNFDTLRPRAERLITVMGREADKRVKVKIIGIETQVPRHVFEKLSAALLQMIKNSMDHGIEEIKERVALGKNPIGNIIIEIKMSPQRVIVSIRDDGRGLNRNSILEKAKERGILVKEVAEYTDRESHYLLLKPGFTTKNNVTMFSGRGVGLDVVHAGIASLGGTVQIESTEHMGTTFFLEVPI